MTVDTAHWIDYRTNIALGFSRTGVRHFPEVCRFALDSGTSAELRHAALSCRANPYLSAETEEFVGAATRCHDVLPADFRRDVRAALDAGAGAALIENVPADPEQPATPKAGGGLPPSYKSTFVSEFCAVVLGCLTGGDVFNFRQEGRGSAPLFDNVVPVPALRLQRGAGGFANNFPFHCESAWHRKRPDYVVLVGVRPDDGAMTLVTSIADLEPEIQATMPAGAFRLKPPDLYVEMPDQGIPLGTPYYRVQDPIDQDTARLSINFNGTECHGSAALDWLRELETHVESAAFGCVLGTGNALVLNNNRTCHTRTGYSPAFGDTARWFVRSNFKVGLWHGERITPADADLMHDTGWVGADGRLTPDFLPYVEDPSSIGSLPGHLRTLAEKALMHTPVPGSRIV